MAALRNEQTYVLKLYRNSGGKLLCRVTDVTSGDRWVISAAVGLERTIQSGRPAIENGFRPEPKR